MLVSISKMMNTLTNNVRIGIASVRANAASIQTDIASVHTDITSVQKGLQSTEIKILSSLTGINEELNLVKTNWVM